ncbi:MAG: MMPL family transporter, partial [Planctomycetales bacterium]
REELQVIRVLSTHSFRERSEEFRRQFEKTQRERGWLEALRDAGGKAMRAAKHLDQFQKTFQSWNHDKLDQGAMRLTFMCAEQDAEEFKRLLTHVEDNVPEDRFDCYVTGAVAQIVYLSEGLISGMMWGLLTSLIAIAALCGALFRSPRLALIAVLPNAFPLIVVFGMMGLFKLPISSGSAMVATVALGIALNDTIHFMLHYRKLTRDEGETIDDAVRDTLRHIGRPIVLTSLVHFAGFSIFWLPDFILGPLGYPLLAGFLPLYHFGLLGCVAMLAALVGDLVLLPSLLKSFDRAAAPRIEDVSPGDDLEASQPASADVAT